MKKEEKDYLSMTLGEFYVSECFLKILYNLLESQDGKYSKDGRTAPKYEFVIFTTSNGLTENEQWLSPIGPSGGARKDKYILFKNKKTKKTKKSKKLENK